MNTEKKEFVLNDINVNIIINFDESTQEGSIAWLSDSVSFIISLVNKSEIDLNNLRPATKIAYLNNKFLSNILTKALGFINLDKLGLELEFKLISNQDETEALNLKTEYVFASSLLLNRLKLTNLGLLGGVTIPVKDTNLVVIGNGATVFYVGTHNNKNAKRATDYSGNLSEEELSQAFVSAMSEIKNQTDTGVSKELFKDVKIADINDARQLNDLYKKISKGWRDDSRSSIEVRQIQADINQIKGTHGSLLYSFGLESILATVYFKPLEEQAQSLNLQVTTVDKINKNQAITDPLATSIQQSLPEPGNYPYQVNLDVNVLSNDDPLLTHTTNASKLAMLTSGIPITNTEIQASVGVIGNMDNDSNLVEPIVLADLTTSEFEFSNLIGIITINDNGLSKVELYSKLNSGINVKLFSDMLSVGISGAKRTLDQISSITEGQTYNHPDNAPLVVEVPLDTSAG